MADHGRGSWGRLGRGSADRLGLKKAIQSPKKTVTRPPTTRVHRETDKSSPARVQEGCIRAPSKCWTNAESPT